MAVTQYIGARYVPIFADPAEWTSTKQYEPLTIVLHEGNSFTSKQFVPVGVDIDNTDYWALTGNYNAQIEAYREEVMTFDNRITANEGDIDALEGLLPKASFDSINTVKKYIDDGTTYVTPEMYGAVGDGITDDTIALQQAIASGKNVLGSNTYLITDGIAITGQDRCVYINKINIRNQDLTNCITFGESNATLDKSTVRINVDCNGYSQTAYHVAYGHQNNFYLYATNVQICVDVKGQTSYENTYNIYADNNTVVYNSVAVANKGNDNIFNTIIAKDFNVCVDESNALGSNVYGLVHGWLTLEEIFPNSKCFIMRGNSQIDTLFNDTYQCGLYLSASTWNAKIKTMLNTFNNAAIDNETVTNNPVVYFGAAANLDFNTPVTIDLVTAMTVKGVFMATLEYSIYGDVLRYLKIMHSQFLYIGPLRGMPYGNMVINRITGFPDDQSIYTSDGSAPSSVRYACVKNFDGQRSYGYLLSEYDCGSIGFFNNNSREKVIIKVIKTYSYQQYVE